MKWINKDLKLPKINEEILLYTRLGHKLDYEIGFLQDINGENGYRELITPGGFICKEPNFKFPDNLKWNIGGHYLNFNDTTHWAVLPKEPKI